VPGEVDHGAVTARHGAVNGGSDERVPGVGATREGTQRVGHAVRNVGAEVRRRRRVPLPRDTGRGTRGGPVAPEDHGLHDRHGSLTSGGSAPQRSAGRSRRCFTCNPSPGSRYNFPEKK
jgi:hypothetical protein